MAPQWSRDAKTVLRRAKTPSKKKDDGPWWLCKCGGWSWADRRTCFECGAQPPTWAKQQHGDGQSREAGSANGAGGFGSNARAPGGVTLADYPFVTIGKGKKGRRQAKQLANDLAELADHRAAKAGGSSAAGDGEADAAGADAGVQVVQAAPMETDGTSSALEVDSRIVAMSDEKLAQVAALLEGELREPYAAEQMRRREARAAGKPVEVRARQANERYKKAKKKAEKAEPGARTAAADLAEAQQKAAAAKKAAAEALEEAEQAKVEYEKFDVEVPVQADKEVSGISISPEEADLICGTFLVVDESAVLAACKGNEAEARAVAARAAELQSKLRAGKTTAAAAGSGKRASSAPRQGHRPPGTHDSIEEMLREAKALRAAGEAGEASQGLVKGRGRGAWADCPYGL